jgi:subtilisin
MATRITRGPGRPAAAIEQSTVSSTTEQLLLAALERGGNALQTGRFLVTYKHGRVDEGVQSLKTKSFRVADARDFEAQAAIPENAGDADAFVFPEIGVALVSGEAFASRGMSVQMAFADESPEKVVEPEYFAFSNDSEYLRGFASAVNTIARDLGLKHREPAGELSAEALGVTWGLTRCKVPASTQSGHGIKVAILDTGLDLGHPDFVGRSITTQTFVGQPVQDLFGHGTHCCGTSCGTNAPPGSNPRYGIAYAAQIFVGKVLTNSGSGTGASVLAGMNWAIANRCEVISMSLGSQSPVQAAYTNAGAAALRNGCLIIAAAGNAGSSTGSPANSPTIMAVASLDSDLSPSTYSNFGKIEIAAPGRDVFSSWPRPTTYRTISGTSMATPHVAGCAALWAQSNPTLRGMNLWHQLQSSTQHLPFPAARVGSGLVQAP